MTDVHEDMKQYQRGASLGRFMRRTVNLPEPDDFFRFENWLEDEDLVEVFCAWCGCELEQGGDSYRVGKHLETGSMTVCADCKPHQGEFGFGKSKK